MRLKPLILVVVATTSAAAVAKAQSVPAVPTVTGGRDIQFGAHMTANYESNVARASAATAAVRGVERQDYIFRPEATVAITQPLGQQVLFLKGSAGYDFYRHNDQLNRQRVDFSGGGVARLLSCQETLFGGYRASQSELQDLSLTDSKNLLKVDSIGASVQCGRPNSLRGSLTVQQSQSKNSAQVRRVSDSDSRTAAATLSYGRPSLGTATLFLSYSDSQFPNRVVPGRPVGDGFFTQTYGIGYERAFGSRIHVNGMLSRTQLKREFAPPGTGLKFTSTTYTASADYRPSQRLQVTVEAAREVRPSQRTGKLYDVNTAYDGVIRYNLGTRISVAAGDRYETTRSNADTVSALAVITSSRSNTIFGSVKYQQSERISFLFDVRQEDRKANLTSFNYSDTRVGLTADVTF